MKTTDQVKAILKANGIKANQASVAGTCRSGATVTLRTRELEPEAIRALLAHLDTYTLEPFPGADYGDGVSIRVEYSKEIKRELAAELIPAAREIWAFLYGTTDGGNLARISGLTVYRSRGGHDMHRVSRGEKSLAAFHGLVSPEDWADRIAWGLSIAA